MLNHLVLELAHALGVAFEQGQLIQLRADRTLEAAYRDWVSAKTRDDKAVVFGKDFRYGAFRAEPNTRYEGCRFYQAQLRLQNVSGVDIVGCDLNSSMIVAREASDVRVVDNRISGDYFM